MHPSSRLSLPVTYIIAKIADLTTYESMTLLTIHGYQIAGMKEESHALFIAKGLLETGRTSEQSAEIDSLCSERLKDTGFKFEFEL